MVRKFLLFSGSDYIEPTPKELKEAYRISPNHAHPNLTLGQILESLAKLAEELVPTLAIPAEPPLVLRSEKHGPFYHVCSIGTLYRPLLGILVAVTEWGKEVLKKDLCYLNHLKRRCGHYVNYFPETYGTHCLDINGIEVLVGVVEWLEGYHELHATQNAYGIFFELWDPGGSVLLREEQAYKFYKGCAQILLWCYDSSDNKRIRSWSHITGDFIFNPSKSDNSSVKLTTIRKYECYRMLPQDSNLKNIYSALLYLLEVLLLNRVDRDKGIGKIILLPKFIINATIDAILDQTNYSSYCFEEALRIFKTLSKQDLLSLYEVIIPELEYPNEIEEFISNNIEHHIQDIVDFGSK